MLNSPGLAIFLQDAIVTAFRFSPFSFKEIRKGDAQKVPGRIADDANCYA